MGGAVNGCLDIGGLDFESMVKITGVLGPIYPNPSQETGTFYYSCQSHILPTEQTAKC